MKKILIAISLLSFSQVVLAAATLPGPLVETDWLEKNAKQVVILDVRKDIKSFTSKPQLTRDKKSGKLTLVSVAGHIPGAILVDYSKIRASRMINGQKIENIIPEKADFEAIMQAAGVNADSLVVITSKGENNLDITMATRLYWQLKYYGHAKLAILNGGMAQWIIEQRPLTNKPVTPARGNWLATAERTEMLASSEDVEKGMKEGVQLVDNRPLAQYLGVYKKSSVSAEGHIPGARSYPNDLFTEASTPAKILPVQKLRDLSSAVGVAIDRPTITYCNTGHLASGGWFILSELMGNKNVKLYDGSMHQWTLEKHPVTKMKME